MKTKILKHDLLELKPESDADLAILGLWAKMTPRIASSVYQSDQQSYTAIVMQFLPIETHPTSHALDASPLAGDKSEDTPGEAPGM